MLYTGFEKWNSGTVASGFYRDGKNRLRLDSKTPATKDLTLVPRSYSNQDQEVM